MEPARKGHVPALLLDDGSLLTEGIAILQYLADQSPDSGLAPPTGARARYELLSWLTYISSELHKMYSPWLFHAEYGADVQRVAREKIHHRLSLIDTQLASDGPFLMGIQSTIADTYLFTIVGWSQFAKVDLESFPALSEFMRNVGDRPAVREVLSDERKRPAA